MNAARPPAVAGPMWVIDPAMHNPENEGVRMVSAAWPGTVRVFRPALVEGNGPTPDDGYAAAAVVVMGSAASPHDDHSWLVRLSAWLTPIARGDVAIPTLGICFGHQLLAHCAGGEVGFVSADRKKLLCVEETKLDGSRLLPGVDSLRVIVSHRETVRREPPNYNVTARRGPITIDGLEHRTRPVFSFQFHPEAGGEFADRAGIPRTDLDARQVEDSQRLLGAFRRLAAGTAG